MSVKMGDDKAVSRRDASSYKLIIVADNASLR